MEAEFGAGAAARSKCRFNVVPTTAAAVQVFAEDADYMHVVAIGFEFSDALTEVMPNFPERTFALVDSGISGHDNGQGLLFGEHELGFLAGAMAGMVSTSKVVGIVAGGLWMQNWRGHGAAYRARLVRALLGVGVVAFWVVTFRAVEGFTYGSDRERKGGVLWMQRGGEVDVCKRGHGPVMVVGGF